MSEPNKYRLQESLGYQLSIASRLQERRLDEGLKPLGLTRITWCILLAVGNEDLLRPSEIAEFVGIDRTATSRALRKMEGDGMIARRGGTDDRRKKAVDLTDLGLDLLQRGTPLAQDNNTQTERNLDMNERAELYRLLSLIRTGDDLALSRL